MERLIEPLLIVFPQSVQPFLKQVFFLAQIIFVLDLKRDHVKKQVVKDLAHEPTPVEEQSVKFVLENFLEDVAQGNYAHLVRVFVVQPEVFGDAYAAAKTCRLLCAILTSAGVALENDSQVFVLKSGSKDFDEELFNLGVQIQTVVYLNEAIKILKARAEAGDPGEDSESFGGDITGKEVKP